MWVHLDHLKRAGPRKLADFDWTDEEHPEGAVMTVTYGDSSGEPVIDDQQGAAMLSDPLLEPDPQQEDEDYCVGRGR